MEELEKILTKVQQEKLSVADAARLLTQEKTLDIGYANIDLHREMRKGSPEVIYGAGKTADQIVGILDSMQQHEIKSILVTRLDEAKAEVIKKAFGDRKSVV